MICMLSWFQCRVGSMSIPGSVPVFFSPNLGSSWEEKGCLFLGQVTSVREYAIFLWGGPDMKGHIAYFQTRWQQDNGEYEGFSVRPTRFKLISLTFLSLVKWRWLSVSQSYYMCSADWYIWQITDSLCMFISFLPVIDSVANHITCLRNCRDI